MNKKVTIFLQVSLILLVLLAIAACAWLCYDLPDLDASPSQALMPSVRVVDRYGRLLYDILDDQSGRHVIVSLEQVPLSLRQATVATEDKNFYKHPGFDLFGVLRAAWINLRGGETISGGSTITQQVARNQLMTEEERATRSVRRKLREIILAWQIEQKFGKDDILAMYLNQTYYGGLAYGVEAAAQTFFGKPVSELDLAESALIAGLPQAPAPYNPYTSYSSAKARQETVLELMQEAGFLTAEEKNLAVREPLILAEDPYPIKAPHFVMMVKAQLDQLFSAQDILTLGGLEVVTTLDLDWQEQADMAINRHLDKLSGGDGGLRHNVNNAALVAIDPQNGQILALVGSPDFFNQYHGGAINMAITPRQPGSALKPLVYAAALDPYSSTGGWTAATMLLDVSTAFQTHDGKAYVPANYDLREHGPVLVRQALASSLNIPAVLALEHIGLQTLADITTKLGITTLGDPHTYDLSLALGGGAVKLSELTAAFGAFANGGYRVEMEVISEIRNSDGEVIYSPPEKLRQQVLDERIAWLISDILSDDQARRLGFGANTVLNIGRPAAVKTGTTSNFHDNWTIGYTPELVVGVWTGNTNYEPMQDVDGLSGAAPIWHDFIRSVLRGLPEKTFTQPEGITSAEICTFSGLLPTDACLYRKTEWFIEGTQPVDYDTFYRWVSVDSRTGALTQIDTPKEYRQDWLAIDLPLEAQHWAQAQGLRLFSDLVKPENSKEPGIKEQDFQILRIISPASGSQYHLTSFAELKSQQILIEAAADVAQLLEVEIYLDDQLIWKSSQAPFRTWWILEAGSHQIWASGILEDGRRITSDPVQITVFTASGP